MVTIVTTYIAPSNKMLIWCTELGQTVGVFKSLYRKRTWTHFKGIRYLFPKQGVRFSKNVSPRVSKIHMADICIECMINSQCWLIESFLNFPKFWWKSQISDEIYFLWFCCIFFFSELYFCNNSIIKVPLCLAEFFLQ